MTLVELAAGIAVLVIGVLGFSQAMVSMERGNVRTRESGRATQAARAILERIQAEAFAEAFRRYNGDPTDDPGGAGTAPGKDFAVPGLTALPDDPDGLPGEVIFPSPQASPGQLREDVVDPLLGMPRDLNGNGTVEAGVDYSTSYMILPVRVRVRWTGAAGPCTVELRSMLANY